MNTREGGVDRAGQVGAIEQIDEGEGLVEVAGGLVDGSVLPLGRASGEGGAVGVDEGVRRPEVDAGEALDAGAGKTPWRTSVACARPPRPRARRSGSVPKKPRRTSEPPRPRRGDKGDSVTGSSSSLLLWVCSASPVAGWPGGPSRSKDKPRRERRKLRNRPDFPRLDGWLFRQETPSRTRPPGASSWPSRQSEPPSGAVSPPSRPPSRRSARCWPSRADES